MDRLLKENEVYVTMSISVLSSCCPASDSVAHSL